ncbi:MAG: URC4/urg3 family protein [Hyphomicrobiaceae bacterium]
MTPDTAAAISILSADAVRQRAHRMLAIGLEDGLEHFRVDLGRLGPAADLVVETTRTAYPDLAVPFHSRWRHFVAGGEDRWAEIERTAPWRDKAERARAAFDLAIASVLLDAGAGPGWSYRDPETSAQAGRSEGLALASLDMFARGGFSSSRRSPMRADAAALEALSGEALARAFQVSAANPLAGVEGRAELLRRLGVTVAAKSDIFARADGARPGGLFDHLAALAEGGVISAPRILSELLLHLGPIWPSRLQLGGVPLGDCWRHPAMVTDDATSGLVPLHKLSQWLAYSLIEPLEAAGIVVAGIDGLTGLAEYRNGGLFVDMGVLVLRDPAQAQLAHDVGSALVVEWRALTVALLDRLAELVRARLAADAVSMPLARILQGGTWAAGRAIARARRADGAPPIKIISDGTVF